MPHPSSVAIFKMMQTESLIRGNGIAQSKIIFESMRVSVEYLANLHAGLNSLNRIPTTDEEKKELFQLKREIVLALVEKVLIKEERKMEVIFKLDVLSLLGLNRGNTSNSGGSSVNSQLAQNKSAGIYAGPFDWTVLSPVLVGL